LLPAKRDENQQPRAEASKNMKKKKQQNQMINFRSCTAITDKRPAKGAG